MLVVETIHFITVILVVITGRWEHALINIHSTRHPRARVRGPRPDYSKYVICIL